MIGRWWRRRNRWRHCFHHDRFTGTSWIKSAVIDPGKVFWCTECGREWYV